MDSTDSPPDIPDFADLAADPEIALLLGFEPVVRKVKRPDGWTPELQRELIARIAAAGTLQEAVWQMGKHATGAEALYKNPDADSFRVAWDAALAIGRRRNGLDSQPPFAGDVPGITRRKKILSSPSDGESGGEGDPAQRRNLARAWQALPGARQQSSGSSRFAFEQLCDAFLGIRWQFVVRVRQLYYSSPIRNAAINASCRIDTDSYSRILFFPCRLQSVPRTDLHAPFGSLAASFHPPYAMRR